MSTTARTAEIRLALVTNLRQAAHNPEHLLAEQPFDASEILCALERTPRSPSRHEQTARVHLSLSGTLLKTLSSPGFPRGVYGIVACGALLWHLQNAQTIEIPAPAYHHPVLPLIRKPGRPEHVDRWPGLGRHLSGARSSPASGHRSLGFSMELIPMPRQRRYQHAIVDSEQVHPLTPMCWEELRSRPHLAQFGGEQIAVRDATFQRAGVGDAGRLVPLRRARPAPSTATSRCSHHGDRRRERRMVPQHHTRQQLLNRVPHRAHRPDTRRSGRRGAADLRAETSCNFYWAEAWVHRCHQDLDCTLEDLEQAPGQLA